MTFGVTPAGFNAMSEGDVLSRIEADQRSEISQTLDLSSDSVLGRNNRIFARRIAEAWAALKAIHDGGDPDQAAADALTSMLKITGASRSGADYSLVPLTVTLERDTRLEAGTHFAHVMGKPSLRWTPVEDFTADADGSFTFMWRAEQTGPIDAAIDSITVIATPVVGWSAITASGEVAIGHDADDDDNARRRREASVQRAGSAATAALRADLLAVATSCQIFENWTDAADPTTGLPPKSFEAVVDAVAATDEIAQILWDSRPAGIESVGTSSGTALDAEGKPHVMRFSRTAQVEVWVTYELVRLDGYVGDDAFKATVATRLDASLKPGDSVSTWEIGEAAHGLGAKIRRVRFGLTPAPSTDTEIAIGTREVARFDAGRITHA